MEALAAVSVTRADGSTAAYLDAVEHHELLTSIVLYTVFGLGALLGGLLLAVAMLLHPRVPRWAGVALLASEPVRVVGLLSGVDLLTGVASLLILTGFVGALTKAHD